MNEEYYKILGVSENSTKDEIKQAYRTKVKEFHPDVNNNPNSEEIFIKIKHSYDEIMKSKKNNFTEETIDDLWKQYKVAGNNFDINNIDPDCIFVGDIYVVKYKLKYDFFAPFEEQTYKKLVQKDAVLLRIGFCEYINLSKIKNNFDVEQIQKKLNDKIKRRKVVILGEFFKPYADEHIATNVRPYSMFDKGEKLNQGGLIKKLIFSRK